MGGSDGFGDVGIWVMKMMASGRKVVVLRNRWDIYTDNRAIDG